MTLKTKTNSPLRNLSLSETISIIKSTSKSSKLSSRVILIIPSKLEVAPYALKMSEWVSGVEWMDTP